MVGGVSASQPSNKIIKAQLTTEVVMTLLLTPETEMAIAEQVKSGRYSTADEVVLEALRLLWERDRADDERRHRRTPG